MFEFIGQFLTLNEVAVIAMFLTFIWLLFRGVPVAMALVGVSLIFVVIAEVLLDPNRSLFRGVIEFDRTGIDYQKLGALSGRRLLFSWDHFWSVPITALFYDPIDFFFAEIDLGKGDVCGLDPAKIYTFKIHEAMGKALEAHGHRCRVQSVAAADPAEVSAADLKRATKLSFSSDPDDLSRAGVFIITVPTGYCHTPFSE